MPILTPLRGGAGVCLDVDGTVLDTEKIWHSVELATVYTHGGTWTESLAEELVGASLPTTARLIAQNTNRPIDEAPQIQEELEDRFADELWRANLPLCPGVQELLHALRVLGAPIGAVSNSPRRLIERALTSAGLNFDVVLCADDSPELRPKPEPDLYREAARQLKIDPHLSWGAEDSSPGLRSLRAAGFLPLATHPLAIPETGSVLIARTLWPLDPLELFAMAASRRPTAE